MIEHPRLHWRQWLQWLQGGLLVIGVLLLAVWSATFFDSYGFQSAESGRLDAALRGAEPGAPEPALYAAFAGPAAVDDPNPAIVRGGVLGRIEIPRLRITAIVAEGSDPATLRRAVGHLPPTALPGQPGNCALAGHRDTFFRGLGGVRENDLVRVVAIDGTYTYRVEWCEVVEPQRVDVLDSTATRSLTLVTCYPFEFIGNAPRRFVVRARQVDVVPNSALRVERAPFPREGLTAERR